MTNSEETKYSISAASIAYAVYRAATRDKYQLHFSALKKQLMKLMAISAIEQFPDTKSGQQLKENTALTHKEQRKFFSHNIIPRYDEIVMLRKIMTSYALENAIANKGIKQVVVAGNGFDILGLSTAAEFKDVMVYVLDRDPTFTSMLNAIRTIPEEIMSIEMCQLSPESFRINDNLHVLNCDLNQQTIENILIPLGFDANIPTFVLAEGLTAYLDEKSNKNLLQTIYQLFKHENSECLIGYIEKLNGLDGLAKEAHEEHKEEHQFALPKNEAIFFVKANNLAISARKTPTDLLADIGKSEDAVYYRNTAKTVEHYYQLSLPTDSNNYNSIEEVPELSIPLSQTHNESPNFGAM